MLTNKLAKELPGILNWSIAGYRSLRKRGHFVQPDSSKLIAEQIELLAAPVKAFLIECCEVGSGYEVEVDQPVVSYQDWCRAQVTRTMGQTLVRSQPPSAVPGLSTSRRRWRLSQRTPTYVGVRLLDTRGHSGAERRRKHAGQKMPCSAGAELPGRTFPGISVLREGSGWAFPGTHSQRYPYY